jgi:hypothetical protein
MLYNQQLAETPTALSRGAPSTTRPPLQRPKSLELLGDRGKRQLSRIAAGGIRLHRTESERGGEGGGDLLNEPAHSVWPVSAVGEKNGSN